MPFKLNQDCRHHIPRQQHKVTNWPAYDASLRQRGNLTVWFTDEAIAAWAAKPRMTRGGQPWYSPLAILTALTIRAVFRLAYRQAEGLLGSVIGLLGLTLPVPDHTTLSRRAATLELPQPWTGSTGTGASSEPLHLLVDSTGLKLCGKGEWLLEKHGTATRRLWRALHLGVDASTGRIVASTLTLKDVDDASQAGPLLDQVAGAVASFTGDGGYDQDRVYDSVAQRHPDAAVVVPPRATAVPSDTAESAPTQRDGHLKHIAEHGRMAWQSASGYNKRARVEATMNRWKQVIGDELRTHTDERRATEVAVAVHALNRMLELGRPNYVRAAGPRRGWGQCTHTLDPCTTLAHHTIAATVHRMKFWVCAWHNSRQRFHRKCSTCCTFGYGVSVDRSTKSGVTYVGDVNERFKEACLKKKRKRRCCAGRSAKWPKVAFSRVRQGWLRKDLDKLEHGSLRRA